jgi:exosortase F-associated protein
MSKPLKYILLIVFFALLILIRFFEDTLFYDPYLTFFQNDYLYLDSPRREVFKLVAFTTLRYVLNSIISLGILFVIFRDVSILKFSSVIFSIAYVVLILLFLFFISNPKQEEYYLFFNIRRFLIQPIILILLVPAFYYHKIKES